ncbi:MAG: hypothetical protein QGG71_22420 [Pirellulaceae bacterium]|nr:hypothetical protein [Pirellulaceae bacterium]
MNAILDLPPIKLSRHPGDIKRKEYDHGQDLALLPISSFVFESLKQSPHIPGTQHRRDDCQEGEQS